MTRRAPIALGSGEGVSGTRRGKGAKAQRKAGTGMEKKKGKKKKKRKRQINPRERVMDVGSADIRPCINYSGTVSGFTEDWERCEYSSCALRRPLSTNHDGMPNGNTSLCYHTCMSFASTASTCIPTRASPNGRIPRSRCGGTVLGESVHASIQLKNQRCTS
ncbi:hypothetical protein SODALDRAFT_139227 [Sodiomyces alkalinus F11]|uniref:Uncharacterized protein n=1 Tax=Sodiomyces alkalinus (strain CBS 110278 / VKM F-3762 / F11) TaxID=1314773 RepID=A0A3N2PZI3_SODAK|nr:hypothetical protein SODALDRAFT_139227 [Sodiomyces alkalinus F11]ROT39846.1 hypothetical protein SODALDRAFT_139227 [Sodiomyces alkalinus F11]